MWVESSDSQFNSPEGGIGDTEGTGIKKGKGLVDLSLFYQTCRVIVRSGYVAFLQNLLRHRRCHQSHHGLHHHRCVELAVWPR